MAPRTKAPPSISTPAGIVVTTGIKPSSTSAVHLFVSCMGGAVSYISIHLFDTLVSGLPAHLSSNVSTSGRIFGSA